MGLVEALNKCDSWAEVEDCGEQKSESGRYGVMIFFNSHEEADDFRECVAIVTGNRT